MDSRLGVAIAQLDAELARGTPISGVRISVDLAIELQRAGLLLHKVGDLSPFWVGELPAYRDRYVFVDPSLDNLAFQVSGRLLTTLD